MKVLVNTSVWSLTLRRPAKLSAAESSIPAQLADIVEDERAAIVGPIRQEILTGELAAEFGNTCLSAGISGSQTNLLLCAVARRRAWWIYPTDQDFRSYADLLSLALMNVT